MSGPEPPRDPAAGNAPPDSAPRDVALAAATSPDTSRALVRNLYLRLLGAIFLVAFYALHEQALLLWGQDGLLPAGAWMGAVDDAVQRGAVESWQFPTLFWLETSDAALLWAARAGMAVSVCLMLLVSPLVCLLILGTLYLSFVTVGQLFLSFQWDNLLLEACFFSLFLAPLRLRGSRAPPPHALAVLLMLWLVLRLHVESGIAKWVGGDPTWRDMTAMATYYETAPLPTWIGWWAHQLPDAFHRASSIGTYVVECLLPLLMFRPRVLRPFVFAAFAGLQVFIVLTANYGFFNYLSLALCLFVLDDGHLRRVAALLPWRPAGHPSRASLPRRRRLASHAVLGIATAVLVPVSCIPFLPWLARAEIVATSETLSGAVRSAQRVAGEWPASAPLRDVLSATRVINAYHLFASMTIVRDELVLEGSDDGEQWSAYEFHYKPGDVSRAPPFVAPFQPRVDFQLWFLLLGRDDSLAPFRVWLGQLLSNPDRALYVQRLVSRVLQSADVVAPLFAHDPFDGRSPRQLRLAVYRYRFTDRAERDASGAWWHRELAGRSPELSVEPSPGAADDER